jgi:flagellar protein FlgJ
VAPVPVAAGKPAPDVRDAPGALRQACQQFEAVFLAQLLQKMRDTVPEDPLLGDSRAKDVYNSMLDWEMAQQIACTQSVGLADMLYRQLSALAPDRDDPGDGAAAKGTESG